MSITAPVFDKADPKSERLFPFHLPSDVHWQEQKDFFGQTSMMGAGAGMFLKNPLIIWGCLIASVISFVNYQPIRAGKDAQNPLMSIGLAIMGVFTINLPKIMLPAAPSSPIGATGA